MIEKQSKTAFLIGLTRGFGVIFSLSIIAISIAGMLIEHNGQDISEASTLFAYNSGLRYGTIMQMAGFSLIMAFFNVILFSERTRIKIRFLFRGFLLLLLTLITASIFALIFKWFPNNSVKDWLSFVFCTIVCFTISFILTLLKLKLEGKKYARLLEGYKARRKDRVNK